MPYLPLARQSLPADYNGERALNVFPHRSDTVAEVQLLGRSGLNRVENCGRVWAMFSVERALFLVAGRNLYEYDGTTLTDRGQMDLVTDPGHVTMAADHANVAVVYNNKYWVWDGTTFGQETSLGRVTTPNGVAYNDGRFVLWGTDGSRADIIQPSDVDDPKTFNTLNSLVSEKQGDSVRALVFSGSYLWALNAETTEIYAPGIGSNIYDRVATKTVGCADGRTAAADEENVYWLGKQGRVYRSVGATIRRVPPPEIEDTFYRKINGEQTLLVQGGFTFNDRGHSFYALTRPGPSTQTRATTWVWDRDLIGWHERATGLIDTQNEPNLQPGFRGLGEEPWIATSAAIFDSTQYIGTIDGLCVQERGLYTDIGEIIRAEVVTVPLERAGSEVEITRLNLLLNTGREDIGRMPKVTMRRARRSQAWGMPSDKDLGLIGEQNRQIYWTKLGSSDFWQFQFLISDPVNRDFLGVHYEAV